MRRTVVLAVIAMLAAACGSTPVQTILPGPGETPGASTGASPAYPTAAPTRTPIPTLDLPPITDLRAAGALEFHATPFPDFIFVGAHYLFVGGVSDGIGMFDKDGTLVTSWKLPAGETCAGFDFAFDSLWSATCAGGPGLVGIDVPSMHLTPVDVGGAIPDSEASVGAGEGFVWMLVDGFPRQLVKVDAAKHEVVKRYDIPGTVTAVRAGVGGVWIADVTANAIKRFDPVSETVAATIPVGRRPQFLAVGEGAVWVMNQADGTVSRIDPATNTVAATIRVGEVIEGGDIAVGGGFVWLHSSATLLFKIDPATNRIVARYGPASGSGGVAADDDAVWISAHDITTIWRLPLR